MYKLSKNQEKAKSIAKLRMELYSVSEALTLSEPLSSVQVDLIQEIISSIYKTGEYKLPKLRGRPTGDQFYKELRMTYHFIQFEKDNEFSLDESFREFGSKNGMSWEDVRGKYYENKEFVETVMHLPEWQDLFLSKNSKFKYMSF